MGPGAGLAPLARAGNYRDAPALWLEAAAKSGLFGEQVLVLAGEFPMGSADSDSDAASDEKPQHTVYLDAFWIDRTEVTKDQYQRCVAAGKCAAPLCTGTGQENHPVVCVSWQDAADYCGWAGRRLPTEAEWEKAARGAGRSAVSVGERCAGVRSPQLLWVRGRDDAGRHLPDVASPYGALDLAGNVWEWVADWYEAGYYARSPAKNAKGPDSGQYPLSVAARGTMNRVRPCRRPIPRRSRLLTNDLDRLPVRPLLMVLASLVAGVLERGYLKGAMPPPAAERPIGKGIRRTMPQMCPGCSRYNLDGASVCAFCSEQLRGLARETTPHAGRPLPRDLRAGCGGMARADLAQDTRIAGREVAIKENLDPARAGAVSGRDRRDDGAQPRRSARDQRSIPGAKRTPVPGNGFYRRR